MLVCKALISPSNQNECLAGRSILGCRFFPFSTLNIMHDSLLACRIYAEKSADSLICVPLYEIGCFSLVAFNILSLSLIFVILITMCLGVFIFGLIPYGTHCASWTWVTVSFFQVREVFRYYIFKCVLSPFLSLFSF